MSSDAGASPVGPAEDASRPTRRRSPRYAALCQEAGLVPVVEPEVLMDGDHTLARCAQITEEVLRAVFEQLYLQRVTLEGMILKPNMLSPGSPAAHRQPWTRWRTPQ